MLPGWRLVSRQGQACPGRPVVLHQVPGQFMGEFKGLDQPLLFEPREGSEPRQLDRFAQTLQGLLVVLQALFPAGVEVGHGAVWWTERVGQA